MTPLKHLHEIPVSAECAWMLACNQQCWCNNKLTPMRRSSRPSFPVGVISWNITVESKKLNDAVGVGGSPWENLEEIPNWSVCFSTSLSDSVEKLPKWVSCQGTHSQWPLIEQQWLGAGTVPPTTVDQQELLSRWATLHPPTLQLALMAV